MKTWKTTGLALTACLAFAAAACQAEVKDDAASKGSGVTVTGNNDQSVTATGGVSNKADGKDSEQNIASDSGSSSSKDSKGGSTAGASSKGGSSAQGGTPVDDDDWKDAAADRNATAATVVGGNAVVANSGGTVHVKENVDQITVTGSDVKVLAKTAKKVSIQGSNVKVFVERVSSVDFNGSDNEVEWANGSRPKINDNGSDNKVEKAD